MFGYCEFHFATICQRRSYWVWVGRKALRGNILQSSSRRLRCVDAMYGQLVVPPGALFFGCDMHVSSMFLPFHVRFVQR